MQKYLGKIFGSVDPRQKELLEILRTISPPRIFAHNGRIRATKKKRPSAGEARKRRREVKASRRHNRKRPVRRHRQKSHLKHKK